MQRKLSYWIYVWIIWILSAAYMFYKYILEVSPNVMAESLMSDFQLHGSGLGNLAASYFYAYLIMQIPVGLLIDKFGPRLITTIAILFCGLGALFFSQSTFFVTAMSSRFMIGLGAAFAAVSCWKLITNWFPHKLFAFMSGLMMSLAMLGAASGVSLLAPFVKNQGWRNATFQIGLAGILLAIVFWLVVRDNPSKKAEKTYPVFQGLKKVLSSSQSWILSIYSGLAFAPISVFGGLWGVTFIRESYQITQVNAAHLTSLIFIGFAIGSPLAGYFSDILGKRKPLMYIGTALGLLSIFFILYVPLPLIILGCALFLFGFTISSFLISFTMIRENSAKVIVATAIGFMNSLNAFFGAFTDPLTGFLLDIFWNGSFRDGAPYFSVNNYKFALAILPIYLFISFILLFFIKETHCKERESLDILI